MAAGCDEDEPRLEVLGQVFVPAPLPLASVQVKGPWRPNGRKLFKRKHPKGEPPETLQQLADRIVADAKVSRALAPCCSASHAHRSLVRRR